MGSSYTPVVRTGHVVSVASWASQITPPPVDGGILDEPLAGGMCGKLGGPHDPPPRLTRHIVMAKTQGAPFFLFDPLFL